MAKSLTIRRYPPTSNKSLQAWNAGDEYILQHLTDQGYEGKKLAICNDRFGYLTCHLSASEPVVIIHRKSQERSIEMNLKLNNLPVESATFCTPFSMPSTAIDIGIIQVPKSLDLFRFFLHKLSSSLSPNGKVVCAFMTRYFSPGILDIANDYFEDVEQSLAVKKSRILILKKRKELPEISFIDSFDHTFHSGETEQMKQYPGVFSAGRVDPATQFLIENLKLADDETSVLDAGSGNGVISRAIQLQKPESELHLMDDSILAVESSKLNLDAEGNKVQFHWEDTLEYLQIPDFDLAVSNPPFHFGHETNIDISIDLFREIAGALKAGGRFICVANNHLGYKPHLKKFFRETETVAKNKKFTIYQARK